jgi:ADYC domain/Pentapeptide repeats (8 copies)
MKNITMIALAFLGSCGVTEDAVGEMSQEVISDNGVSLNGVSLNGVSLNGVSLNGVSLNGVSLNGVSLNGVSLNGVSLDGTSLTGVRTDTGATTSGPVVGSTMRAALSNGATLALRFDGALAVLVNGVAQWAYAVSYNADGGWRALCGTGIGAFAIPGTWDTRSGVPGGGAYAGSAKVFTLACRGMTIAKCVEMGYTPSSPYKRQLQACVRLLRGDYCGDGSTWTVTGNQVNIYDGVGVQTDTMAWDIEAEWTPDGARCLSARRETRFATSIGVLPTCVKDGVLQTHATCGQDFAKAELISEIPPETVTAAKTARVETR